MPEVGVKEDGFEDGETEFLKLLSGAWIELGCRGLELILPAEGRIKDGSRDSGGQWEQQFPIYFTSIERLLEPSSHIWQIGTNLLLELLRLRAGSSENIQITPRSSIWILPGMKLWTRHCDTESNKPTSVLCKLPLSPLSSRLSS